jgi:CheY-like chemotaxis protein
MLATPVCTVLVVGNEERFRRTLAEALRQSGLHVVECVNTTEAIDIVKREHVDVLVSRVRMQGHPHGFALARMARLRRPGIRVVLHAVRFEELPSEEIEDAPGSSVPRPADPLELMPLILAEVDRVLSAAGGHWGIAAPADAQHGR